MIWRKITSNLQHENSFNFKEKIAVEVIHYFLMAFIFPSDGIKGTIILGNYPFITMV